MLKRCGSVPGARPTGVRWYSIAKQWVAEHGAGNVDGAQAALAALVKQLKEPTDVQWKMAAVDSRDGSMLVRGPAGTGKSTGALAQLASRTWLGPRPSARMSSLVLVPTPQLALQYEQRLRRVLDMLEQSGDGRGRPGIEKDREVRVLFRGQSSEDERQLDALKRHGSPRVLVGTPTRVLDYLSSGYDRLLPVDRVRNVLVSEAEALFPSGADSGPASTLLKFVHQSWTHAAEAKREAASHKRQPKKGAGSSPLAPLRYTLLSSAERAELQPLAAALDGCDWIGTRPLTMIGTSKFAGVSEALDVFPSHVRLQVCDDQTEPISFEAALAKNVIPRPPTADLPGAYANLAEIETKIDFSADETRQADAYALTLRRLAAGGTTPCLALVPDELHLPSLVDRVAALSLRPAVVGLTPSSDGTPTGFVASQPDGQQVSVSLDDLTSTTSTNGKPDVLLVRAADAAGIDVPNLAHVVALGFRSLPSGSLGRAARLARSASSTLTVVTTTVNLDIQMWERIALSLASVHL